MRYQAFITLSLASLFSVEAHAAFVDIPETGFGQSAYRSCSTSGAFGKATSDLVNTDTDACHVVPRKRKSDAAPLPEFLFKTLAVREVHLPEQYGDPSIQSAVVYDFVFRHESQDECIFATLVHMNPVTLKNGESWEINDITRGGFAGRPVSAAYFFSYHPKGIRSTENVFRIGRTHTAVPHRDGDADLPGIENAPAPKTPISTNQKAAISSNWVTFTTDLNANDPDGTSFFDSSVLYIKTTCNADNPVEYPDAIRLKTTGQNGQTPMEIRLPGFAPTGATIELY
ncbi:hypothetical protein [Methylovorus glucosotrophus]|uniref:Uncharacterized protein n=1 Tax=Methylovorus glucosotrophus (strain SIP3-4) TaxID=582744 RepID=C6XC21_METGS|nr:hypothetical protein [Methylovorus glucosotrophus]ACT50096.1 conserved hypothetical protein [Methylovorus glucosotrophus SIP3-4]